MGGQSHMQLVREHLATVFSARLATVDQSWRKEWNLCARANLHWKKKNAGREWKVEHFPKILASDKKATTTKWTKSWNGNKASWCIFFDILWNHLQMHWCAYRWRYTRACLPDFQTEDSPVKVWSWFELLHVLASKLHKLQGFTSRTLGSAMFP